MALQALYLDRVHERRQLAADALINEACLYIRDPDVARERLFARSRPLARSPRTWSRCETRRRASARCATPCKPSSELPLCQTRPTTELVKAAGVGQPRIGEQVETFMQAALGMGIEVRGALSRVGASAASVAIAPARPSLGGTACGTGVVHVANDGGEVAIADPDLAAARMSAKPALGLSFATMRLAIARVIARWLPRCPACHALRRSGKPQPARI